MDRTLYSVKGTGSGRHVTKKLFLDLNKIPEEEETDDQPKVVGQSSVVADNSLRDKNGEDASVVIRDRKVQVSEGTSFYALARAWLKKEPPLKYQPQYLDTAKPLPKPLPASVVKPRKEVDMELEEENGDVSHLTEKELLQVHVRRAKKVRERLRNQRLQRIGRYKDRLALLLPPVAEEKPKNGPAA